MLGIMYVSTIFHSSKLFLKPLKAAKDHKLSDHDLTPSAKWHLITIDDPNFLPGKNIIQLLKLMRTLIPIQYVILDDVEGSGSDGLINSLQNLENTPLKLDTLLEKLIGVNQFEWCDFFLFIENPLTWHNSPDYDYPNLINQSDITIRAIDGQYMYLYTPLSVMESLIKEKYTLESFSTDFLENLDYPY